MRSSVYKLDLTESAALRQSHPVFYVNLFMDFRDNGLRQKPLSIEVDGKQEFEVEAVVAHRVFRVQTQYMDNLLAIMLLRTSAW